ncbi:hypothetical protein FNF29_03146 [Cafeteria roenbergensis]|uniref:Uncharacterized protein n=1 Tax=Cafeteria roenbergensis TaxID=33653 RepID=A0A5A8DZL3_CAFRO|nr:hypothetical protein FNF29_03146 [Cafeteria roenbergensis]KAA0170936.1 hypothetical protein FNF28_01214 [Cafeteria roenbergensis]|eukprot:KAA0153333.1 hypothetical protein FNF29_03146 [Cafeteria roenbergensis]
MAVGADGRLRPGVCGLDHALAAAIREYASGDSLSASSFLRVWEQRSLRLLHVLLDDAADPHSRLIRYCDAYACALAPLHCSPGPPEPLASS